MRRRDLGYTLLPILAPLAPAAAARSKKGFDIGNATVPWREIEDGGPPRDGIPALFYPQFMTSSEATFLDNDDRIIGVVVNGQAKAYPIRILNWHEIVNDRIGTRHLVVTYCPLCGTGMVFSADRPDGPLTFGVSGLLYNNDLLLYDRQSESLWSQVMGRAISGPLAGSELTQIPATHTSWGDWVKRHSSTLVMSEATGYRRNYRRSPYAGYERSQRLFFKVSHRAPREYHAKALVIGVRIGDLAKAYPFEELREIEGGRVVDTIGNHVLSISWDADSDSAEIHDANGELFPAVVGYWFAWYAFHPHTQVFRAADCRAGTGADGKPQACAPAAVGSSAEIPDR